MRQAHYVKYFTKPEVDQIIKEIVASQAEGQKEIFPEDICVRYADRGVMPWDLASMFADAGMSVYFRIKHYGNKKIDWKKERDRFWDMYWNQQLNDWEIAKILGTSWQTIRRKRSYFHHVEQDKRWVLFIHTIKKGMSSTQEKLKHSTASFTKETVEPSKHSLVPLKEVYESFVKKYKDLEADHQALLDKHEAIVRQLAEPEVHEAPKQVQTLNHAIITNFEAMGNGIDEQQLKAILTFVPYLDLCKMIDNMNYHCIINGTTSTGPIQLFFSLVKVDLYNLIAWFQFEFRLDTTDVEKSSH